MQKIDTFLHDHLVDQLKFRIFIHINDKIWDRNNDIAILTGKAGRGAECNINTGRVDRTLPYKKNKSYPLVIMI